MRREGVGKQGILYNINTGTVFIHQEQDIIIVRGFCLYKEKVCQVARGDKPLFPVYQVTVIGTRSAAVDHLVGSRFGFGNGIGLAAPALK